MNNIATISGWGQPHDALANIADDALHINYAPLKDFAAALEQIRKEASDAETIIGWSLGGLLALHAASHKYIAPNKIILIAPPYQFVKSKGGEVGMGQLAYEHFVNSYARAAERTLGKSYKLISHGDKHAERVDKHLAGYRASTDESHWHYWLDALGQYDCRELDFEHLPETHIIHGENDTVIEANHASKLHSLIPNSTLHLLPDCGHAPHLHAPELVRKLVA